MRDHRTATPRDLGSVKRFHGSPDARGLPAVSGGQSTRQPSAILGVTRARFAAVAQRIENGLRFGQDMIQPYEADPD